MTGAQDFSGLIPDLPDSIPSPKEELEMLKSLPFDELVNTIVGSMVHFVVNLAIALLVFYVGKFIIKKLHRLVQTMMVRRRVDASLSTFVLSLVKMVLYFILIVTVIGIMGIETSSFIALFASAGVAIGMALSGTLQNFAGGVLILLLKPYKVGDYIEASGYAGTVKEIQIFHTIITTPDNKSIIIPNGGLSTGSINNYSREDYRRVEWTVGISYGDSVDAARHAILDMFAADDRIVREYIADDRQRRLEATRATMRDSARDLPEQKHGFWTRVFNKQRSKVQTWQQKNDTAAPLQVLPPANCQPVVYVAALADSSVNLTIRAWTPNSTYWAVFFHYNERFYNELPKHGINFPFPQLDVHLPGNNEQISHE